MKRRSLRSLHRDQGGQIVPLFMLGLVSIVLSVAMILNTGRAIHNRTRVQNAADAAAITQASWAARSLNVISMNNVGLVHMFTVFMVSNAFGNTWIAAWKAANDRAKEASTAYDICMGATAIFTLGTLSSACEIYDAYEIWMRAIQAKLFAIEARYTAMIRGWPTSMRLIGAFGRMSDHIVEQFPRFTWQIAERMREANGVDEVLFFPMSEKGQHDEKARGTELPVQGGLLESVDSWGPMVDICIAAEKGPGTAKTKGQVRANFAKHGYEQGEGPYTRSKEDPGWMLTSMKWSDVLPMSPPDFDPPFAFPSPLGAGGPLANLWNTQWLPPLPILWDWVYMDTDPDWPTESTPYFPFLHQYLTAPPLPPGLPLDPPQTRTDNEYTRRMQRDWRETCKLGTGEFSTPALLSRPRVFMLTAPDPALQLLYPGQGSHKYFVRDPLALMAFAVKREESMIAPNKFENPPGGTYAYAQAHVYNIVSYDLYTQAWGARLEPARFLEDGEKRDEVVEALRREDGFDDLYELFRQIPASDFRRASAH